MRFPEGGCLLFHLSVGVLSPKEQRVSGCLSDLCPEKCNLEQAYVHRKVSQRILLRFIIATQRRKKPKSLVISTDCSWPTDMK